MISRRAFIGGLAGGLLAAPLAAEAQPAGKVYRVGIVLESGPYYTMIDGLKDGVKELAFEEGKQYVLHIRDVKGDPKALEATARAPEQERVDLIYSLAISVTLAVKRATAYRSSPFFVTRSATEVRPPQLAVSPNHQRAPRKSGPTHPRPSGGWLVCPSSGVTHFSLDTAERRHYISNSLEHPRGRRPP
jgi:hypothetical protein